MAIVHVVTVPIFWISILMTFSVALTFTWKVLILGELLLLGALIAQGLGHKREIVPPEPFLGSLDFFSRLMAEQLITFPRWWLFK